MQPTLLFVDDEPNFLVLVDRVLSKEGYRITTALDSRQALAYVDCADFSLAVLDIKMAPIDGIEVLARIKKRSPSTRVVMVTGFPTEENRAKCIKLGADGYLIKPIDFPQLITLLRNLTLLNTPQVKRG
jgi:DNA-binding response OmpR family regulator